MSAFYIQNENLGPIPNVVRMVFRKRGFLDTQEYLHCGWRILIGPKLKIKGSFFLEKDGVVCVIAGTCIVPKRTIQDSAQFILEEYISNGNVDCSLLCGNFILIFIGPKGIEFQTDCSNGQHLYYHNEKEIWSDSQLTLVHALHDLDCPTAWNNESIEEALITGCIVGKETLFKDIFRFVIQDQSAGCWRFLSSDRFVETEQNHLKSLDEMINAQIKTLHQYFDDIQPALMEHGVSCGITGGLDSRLLLLCLTRFAGVVPASAFTNSRSKASKQVGIVKKLMSQIRIPWEVREVPLLAVDAIDNMYFNDGVLRIYQIWIEEIKSRSYILNLYQDRGFLLSGVGGEQYRNSEFLAEQLPSFEHWFQLEVIRKFSGKAFVNSMDEKKFIARMRSKIFHQLELNGQYQWGMANVKRYFNELFNPGNRLIRNSVENQVGFILSPFTDYRVSKRAYDAIGYLGTSLEFERKMVQRIAPDLSNIPMDYGFAPNKETPFFYAHFMTLKRFMPKFILEWLYCRKKGKRLQKVWMKIPKAEEGVRRVKEMDLSVNIDYLLTSELMAPLVVQLGLMDVELKAVLKRK